MAIARYPSVVIDCPDAESLATFYGALLGWKVDASDGWADIRPEDGGNCISFQQVTGYLPPRWPAQDVPQQMHFDLMVKNLDDGETVVLGLGGTKADIQPCETFRVYLDPAGHPFCLCLE